MVERREKENRVNTQLIREIYSEILHNYIFSDFGYTTKDTMLLMLNKLDNPHMKYKSVHITGTNGKGSNVVKIAAAFQLSGYKVGMFTSPHISTYRERIQINKEYIPMDELIYCYKLCKTAFDSLRIEYEGIKIGYFGISCLIGLLYFGLSEVDIAIIEVGIGGINDSTNIITPILSIITNIDEDHMPQLGNTLSQVAENKSGIIKKNVPVLAAAREEQLLVIRERAKIMNSPVTEIDYSNIKHETFDKQNSLITEKAINIITETTDFIISLENMQTALKIRPPCRLEEINIDVVKHNFDYLDKYPDVIVCDVAHNIPALKKIFSELKGKYPEYEIITLLGTGRKLILNKILNCVLENSKYVYFVKNKFAYSTLLDVPYIYDQFTKYTENKSLIHLQSKVKTVKSELIEGDIEFSIEESLQLINKQKTPNILLITGSFLVMEEALLALGIQREIDPEISLLQKKYTQNELFQIIDLLGK